MGFTVEERPAFTDLGLFIVGRRLSGWFVCALEFGLQREVKREEHGMQATAASAPQVTPDRFHALAETPIGFSSVP